MKNISICICAFNAEIYIDRCISSIKNLDTIPYEIIFIDDGSTDNTYDVIKKYISDIPQLHIYKFQKNMGAGYARNEAIRQASGDYIWSVDCDDTITPNSLSIFLKILDRYESDVVVGSINYITEKNKIVSKFSPPDNFYNISPIEYPELALYTTGYHVSMVIKKEILEKYNIIYGEGLKASEDGFLLFNLIWKINKLSLIKDSVYNYYFDISDSRSKLRTKEYYKDDFYAWAFLIRNAHTHMEIDYAANRFMYRVKELLNFDCKKYLSYFSDDKVISILKLFNSIIQNKIFTERLMQIAIEKNSTILCYHFLQALSNNDYTKALKIIRNNARIKNNILRKIIFKIKKYLKICLNYNQII